MTDAAGDIVWEATYEAFGKAVVDPESTVTNNLRFPGQYWEQESGLHYNWQRYYDPGTGRYVKKDPIGFAGLQANLFKYSGQNPVNIADVNGLREWKIDRVGTSASILIFGVSGQIVTFTSSCENNIRLKRTYVVVGAGLGVGLGIKGIKVLGEVLDHSFAKSGNDHLGATQVDDINIPKYGISVSGPSAALLYGGGIGSANIAFGSYSEVYALTDGPGLGVSIFNFEGQKYFMWSEVSEKCKCEKITKFDEYYFLNKR
jgi:RHS repeat-associated protein